MAELKNLCAAIPIDLHQKVSAAKEKAGLTIGPYITMLLTEYFEMKENGGNKAMTCGTRTMAFQIPESLFLRIKAHLDRETERTGWKLTQRDFVLNLITRALDEAERVATDHEPNTRDTELLTAPYIQDAAESELTPAEQTTENLDEESEAAVADESDQDAAEPDESRLTEDEAAGK